MAKARAGTTIEWDAEIIEDRPNGIPIGALMNNGETPPLPGEVSIRTFGDNVTEFVNENDLNEVGTIV